MSLATVHAQPHNKSLAPEPNLSLAVPSLGRVEPSTSFHATVYTPTLPSTSGSPYLKSISAALASKGDPVSSSPKQSGASELLGAKHEVPFAPPARIVHKEIDYSISSPGAKRSAATFNGTTDTLRRAHSTGQIERSHFHGVDSRQVHRGNAEGARSRDARKVLTPPQKTAQIHEVHANRLGVYFSSQDSSPARSSHPPLGDGNGWGPDPSQKDSHLIVRKVPRCEKENRDWLEGLAQQHSRHCGSSEYNEYDDGFSEAHGQIYEPLGFAGAPDPCSPRNITNGELQKWQNVSAHECTRIKKAAERNKELIRSRIRYLAQEEDKQLQTLQDFLRRAAIIENGRQRYAEKQVTNHQIRAAKVRDMVIKQEVVNQASTENRERLQRVREGRQMRLEEKKFLARQKRAWSEDAIRKRREKEQRGTVAKMERASMSRKDHEDWLRVCRPREKKEFIARLHSEKEEHRQLAFQEARLAEEELWDLEMEESKRLERLNDSQTALQAVLAELQHTFGSSLFDQATLINGKCPALLKNSTQKQQIELQMKR